MQPVAAKRRKTEMSSIRWVLVVVAGVAIASAVGFAAFGRGGVAQADSGTKAGGAYETALAQQLGISVDQLHTAQAAAFDSVVDQAVNSGRLTADQGAKLKEAGPARAGRGLIRRAVARGRAAIGQLIDSAAKTIGISTDDVKSGLQSGQSLTQIAAAHNVTADQLKSGITVDINAKLEDAVKAGKISQPQADRVMNALNNHLDQLINRTKGSQQ
jgi:polyhydroxyalkanoate synthesis regulator phasin